MKISSARSLSNQLIPIRIQIKTFECPCIIPSKLSVIAIIICLKATWYKYISDNWLPYLLNPLYRLYNDRIHRDILESHLVPGLNRLYLVHNVHSLYDLAEYGIPKPLG